MNRRVELNLLDKVINKSSTGFQSYNFTTGRTVLGTQGNVTRSEFYQAAAAGMQPSAVFIISEADYDDEKYLIHSGKRYRILRTYRLNGRKVELTCEGDAPNDA